MTKKRRRIWRSGEQQRFRRPCRHAGGCPHTVDGPSVRGEGAVPTPPVTLKSSRPGRLSLNLKPCWAQFLKSTNRRNGVLSFRIRNGIFLLFGLSFGFSNVELNYLKSFKVQLKGGFPVKTRNQWWLRPQRKLHTSVGVSVMPSALERGWAPGAWVQVSAGCVCVDSIANIILMFLGDAEPSQMFCWTILNTFPAWGLVDLVVMKWR